MNINQTRMFPVKAERKLFRIYNVVFIDPGIGGTGWAFFPEIRTAGDEYKYPSEFGEFLPKKRSQWQTKIGDVCAWFDGYCDSRKPSTLVVEWPELWISSAKSQASAASGNLGKLLALCGGLMEVSRRNEMGMTVTISAKRWKGQLPKEAVRKRVLRRIPHLEKQKLGEHEVDALGMGIAAQGKL